MRYYCSFFFCTNFSCTFKNQYRRCLSSFKTINITSDNQRKCRLVVTISTSDCLFWPRSHQKNLFEASSVCREQLKQGPFLTCFNFAHLPTLPQIFASSLHYWVFVRASSPPLPKPIKRAVLEIITNVKELLNCHLSKQMCNQFSFVLLRQNVCLIPPSLGTKEHENYKITFLFTSMNKMLSPLH